MSRFYVTTPIYYVTDAPHLGHAYTTVVADTLARYHRLRGDDTRFLTGTDEHGQKVERMAADRGSTAAEYANAVSDLYRNAWRILAVTNDDFIRTTDPDHEAVVVELWNRMQARGDIYLGHYEGWYCVDCEQFYKEKELEGPPAAPTCPVHKRSVEKVKEEGYFFRLSAYQKRLQDFYDDVLARTGRPFIEPAIRMNEVRAFVDAGLEDLSASRTTFQWGVPVPGRAGHVIYVWIDALTNYYSATRRPALAGFWDDAVEIVHLMGKDITRFHAVYWPAVLMSAGLRLPSKIVAHGWWTIDGEKMSKSRGNVVDPLRLVEDLDASAGAPVGTDAFRYFVMREAPLGPDGDFSHAALLTRYNAELCNDLGNLLNRTLGMVAKYLGDTVPPPPSPPDIDPLSDASLQAAGEVADAMRDFAPSRALEAMWRLVRAGNEFIEQSAPWKQTRERQAEVLWSALNACRVLSHLVEPFMPGRAAEMRRQLGAASDRLDWRAPWKFDGAFHVTPARPLFPRIDDDKKRELLARWAPKPAGDAATQQPDAATQQPAAAPQQTPAAPAPKKAEVAYDDFARLDLRVARIAAAEKVPKKDKLLKLSLDLGAETRTVVAGVAAAYAPADLVGRHVIFLANLKPAKIGGIVSEGMILAAGDPEVLALSALDRACPPGTRVK
jgi:methionyl-tRNA synthetase